MELVFFYSVIYVLHLYYHFKKLSYLGFLEDILVRMLESIKLFRGIMEIKTFMLKILDLSFFKSHYYFCVNILIDLEKNPYLIICIRKQFVHIKTEENLS